MTPRLLVLLFLLLIPAAARAQNTSKEIFAQARAAAAGSAQQIELYERYTRMEPDDAWGHLALAEALAAARRFGEAQNALRRAETLAPGEEDVAVVKARLERARRNYLPSVKPLAYITHDTDDNTSLTIGAAGDAALSASVRAGITGGHTSIDDGASNATVERAAAALVVKSNTVRWDAELGGARLNHVRTRTVPVGQTHLRVTTGAKGVTADARVRMQPVTSVYSLVAAETMITEARGLLDIPVVGGLKLRASGQIGQVEAGTLTPIGPAPSPGQGRGNQRQQYLATVNENRRVGFGGGLVLAYAPVAEAAVTGYRLQYDHAGPGLYFAPEYVDVVEIGTYAEIYRFDPVTIAIDAGVGAQRAKSFNQPEGEVEPAYRLWSQVTVPLGRYVDLNGEVDFYQSQLGAVTTGAGWSSLSGGLSLRWLLR
jgi:hypothetical protein